MALIIVENGKMCFNQQLLTYMKKQKTGQDARSFIEGEANLPHLVDSTGSTLLHHAALLNCTVVAEYLVNKGCDVDARDNLGNTPLMLAVKKSSQKTTGVLLKANADMYVLDDTAKPLVCSVLRSRVDRMIKIFLGHIQSICSNDCDKMARKFIEVQCPLYVATLLKRADVIKSMLDAGYSVDSRDNHLFGETTLHVAVEQGNIEIVKVLVEYGANIDARASNDDTPLFKYTEPRNGNPHEILRFFIDKGVNLMATNNLDQTLIFYLIDRVDVLSVHMLSPYIDFFVRDSKGKTALHCLASNFNDGVIEFARNQKFDVNSRDYDGTTPLMMAVEYNLLENVKFLLENGADVAMANNVDETALTLAFTSEMLLQESDDMIRVVELLLLSGANAQQLFNDRKTIFDSKPQPGLHKLFKPVLACLVLIEANGIPIIEQTRNEIAASDELKKCFDLYKRQYEKLKEIRVYESVSLQTILLENRDRIAAYKRNPQFVSEFKRLMKYDKPNVNSYYLKTLCRRVNNATM